MAPLAARGHFASPPERVVHPDGSWKMRTWEEGEYLARIAPRAPEAVAEQLLRVPITLMNPAVWAVVADAAMVLPVAYAAPLTSRIAKTDDSLAPLSVHASLWNLLMEAIPAPLQHSGIMKVWRVACESLGIYGVRLHDLRHCHGQWLIDAGVSEHDVMRSLRHKTVGMTRRYTRRKESKNVAVAIAGVLMPNSTISPPAEVPMVVAIGEFLAPAAPRAQIGSGESSTGEAYEARQ